MMRGLSELEMPFGLDGAAMSKINWKSAVESQTRSPVGLVCLIHEGHISAPSAVTRFH